MAGLIAHEWIAQHGGSENVLAAMVEAYPDAEIHTLWNDAPERFAQARVIESWLARTRLRHHKALALPFMSNAWSRVDTSEADFVLASSHVFAHHVGGRKLDGNVEKFVYVHTPMRTVYAADQDSRGMSLPVRMAAGLVRNSDRRFVDTSVHYAANSHYIRERIDKVWGQQSRVIHPPVDTSTIRSSRLSLNGAEEAQSALLPDDFILGASRFVPYKRLDLVIAVAERLRLPAVIAGRGPQRDELVQIAEAASVPVFVVEGPSNAMLHHLYRRASTFVFPAVEDFGIMPLEAMAAGTPVVVGAEGGACEGVEAVHGGVVAHAVTIDALAAAVQEAQELDLTGVPDRVDELFGTERFVSELRHWVEGR